MVAMAQLTGVLGTVTIHDANEVGDVELTQWTICIVSIADADAAHRVALWHGGISSCMWKYECQIERRIAEMV
jgi:hypothetical protein